VSIPRNGKADVPVTAEISIDRAMSDYLSVSRRAHLYGPKAYEEAEARAWERLQEALGRADSDTTGGTDPRREREPAGL
jgi:hypothetical protein